MFFVLLDFFYCWFYEGYFWVVVLSLWLNLSWLSWLFVCDLFGILWKVWVLLEFCFCECLKFVFCVDGMWVCLWSNVWGVVCVDLVVEIKLFLFLGFDDLSLFEIVGVWIIFCVCGVEYCFFCIWLICVFDVDGCYWDFKFNDWGNVEYLFFVEWWILWVFMGEFVYYFDFVVFYVDDCLSVIFLDLWWLF